MTFTPITPGTQNWDGPLNAALTALDTGKLDSALASINFAPKGMLSQVFPVRTPASKALLKKTVGNQQIRVLGFGDSVASLKLRWMFDLINRAYGGGVPGTAIGAGQSGTGYALPGITVNSVTGTVSGSTTDFDIWPSGLSQTIGASGVVSYGVGGVSATFDSAKVYYAKEASGGTFKVQVDGVDAAGFTNVSAAGTLGQLGIATITVAPTVSTTLAAGVSAGVTSISTVASIPNGTKLRIGTGLTAEDITTTAAPTGAGPYTIAVGALRFAHSSAETVVASPIPHTFSLSQLTGAVRVVGVGFFNSQSPGAAFSTVSQGGIALNSATNSATGMANFATFLTDYAPDLMTFEMKEDSSYYAAALTTLLSTVKTASPNTVFVGIGSTPVASGDADQVIQNGQLQAACAAQGYVYWDGYAPIGSYANMTALGWQGDGVHPDDKASAFLAGLLVRDLGLLDHFGLARGFDIDSTVARARQRLEFGNVRFPGDTPQGTFEVDTAFGEDVTYRGRRNLEFQGPNGSLFFLALGGGQDSYITSGIKIRRTQDGAGVYLIATDANEAYVNNARGGGAMRDWAARSFRSGISTLTGQSGAVTLDISLGGVILVNLTGNVTSWLFSNAGNSGQEIEVHFIQDATGSRTLAGANGAIRLAGNALTLSTGANKRDIVRFRQLSGGYYETSRSLNV